MRRRRFLSLSATVLPAALAMQPRTVRAATAFQLNFSGLCAFVPDYVNDQLHVALVNAPQHEPFLVAKKGSEGWSLVFREMKAQGLVTAKNLDQVVSPRASRHERSER